MIQKKMKIQIHEHRCSVCKKDYFPRNKKQTICKICNTPYWEGYRKGRANAVKEFNKELKEVFQTILE